ncbi:MAG: lactate utilization protein [Alphaproteobacteria bacterium]|nr:lactate utilization protein [Alphaproteobacteria bacterium]MBV9693786.1 lactate utilization protein [Alphaproteobacteria bacterium]
MSARQDILDAIRARRRGELRRPQTYRPPSPASDPLSLFVDKARAADTEVRILESEKDIPAAVAELLRARNQAARVHLPPLSDLRAVDWRLEVEAAPPGPDDAAVTRAPLAIAETGTLVQPSGDASPASWHFRPGLEIAILHARDIVAHLEDALARLGRLPGTVNLITGPSRTGDIEQTLELGAHGPKALAVIVVRD